MTMPDPDIEKVRNALARLNTYERENHPLRPLAENAAESLDRIVARVGEAKGQSSWNYRAAIYFAVATMHFYRDDVQPLVSGETLGDFAARNDSVVKRVCREAEHYLHYELSHEQIGRAIQAYLAPSVSLSSRKWITEGLRLLATNPLAPASPTTGD